MVIPRRGASRRRGLGIVGGLALIALVLSGCGGYSIVRELDSESIVGTWTVVGGTAQLRLAGDGTFESTDWPRDLGCGGSPTQTSDVQWRDIVDYRGTWEVVGDDVRLRTTFAGCDWGLTLYFVTGVEKSQPTDALTAVVYLGRREEPFDDPEVTVRLIHTQPQ